MSFINYYAVLGLEPGASDEEIRLAYRSAARRFHPDMNRWPGAAAVFKDLNEANDVLSDRIRRNSYDSAARPYLEQPLFLRMDIFGSRQTMRAMPETQLYSVMVRVQPALKTDESANALMNLCLVVDRSKSMDGSRLQQVKAAVTRILDDARAEDVFSLVTFSDRAEVVVRAQHPEDTRSLKAQVSTIRADGATAILAGLKEGLAQVEAYRSPRFVNHLVLVTDGRTYGDEDECLKLAEIARSRGIGISGMGIGEDWNDSFLDRLTAITGGSSSYIRTPEQVTTFLNGRIRSLATSYAERTQLVIAPAAEVELKSVTRISPEPAELPPETGIVPLGTVEGSLATTLILEFHLQTKDAPPGPFTIARLDIHGEVLGSGQQVARIIRDLSVRISDETQQEDPPAELLDALGRLRLYRLQERAREAMSQGEVAEATRQLEYLATRLFESGQEDLGQAALHEARRVAHTAVLSEEGAKRLKYGTRSLLPTEGDYG